MTDFPAPRNGMLFATLQGASPASGAASARGQGSMFRKSAPPDAASAFSWMNPLKAIEGLQWVPLGAPRAQIQGGATTRCLCASGRSANAEDGPVPPQPAGRRGVAASGGVRASHRCARHRF